LNISQRLTLRAVKRAIYYFSPLILLNIIWTYGRQKLTKSILDNPDSILDFPGKLDYEKSKYHSETGTIRGESEGYSIDIDPENDASIHLTLHSELPVEIWDKKSHSRPSGNMINVSTANSDFNAIFGTIRTWSDNSDYFGNQSEILDAIVEFYSKWMNEIRSFILSGNRIYCSLNYGQPFFPYVSLGTINQIIPDLVSLAGKLDESEFIESPGVK
jgi:hypothetical protein